MEEQAVVMRPANIAPLLDAPAAAPRCEFQHLHPLIRPDGEEAAIGRRMDRVKLRIWGNRQEDLRFSSSQVSGGHPCFLIELEELLAVRGERQWFLGSTVEPASPGDKRTH